MYRIGYQSRFTGITRYIVDKEDFDRTAYSFLRNRKLDEIIVVEDPGYMEKRRLLVQIGNRKRWIINNLQAKNIRINSLDLDIKDTYNIYKIDKSDLRPYLRKFSPSIIRKDFEKFFNKTCEQYPMLKNASYDSQITYATIKYADKLKNDFAKFLEKRKVTSANIY